MVGIGRVEAVWGSDLRGAALGSLGVFLLLAFVVPALLPAHADAFGTVNIAGQRAEHERITRALECANPDPVADCLQERTTVLLAGRDGSLGAVGKPDDLRELYAFPYAHCDGGDYFERAGYPQSVAAANANLQRCAATAFSRLNAAVDAAGQIVDSGGRLRAGEAGIGDCSLTSDVTSSSSRAGSAKCQVINQTGRALHAIEDFWSHSNWADAAGPGATSVTNPPGLVNPQIPDFFRYASSANVPAEQLRIPSGLISGCDDSSPLEVVKRECGKSGTGDERVKHADLNKDRGLINPRTGATSDAKTDRGRVAGGANFAHAVAGARSHVIQTWADLTGLIRMRYPGDRGERIVGALSSDHPWTRCDIGGKASGAHDPPKGSSKSATSASITIENRTANGFGCAAAVLDSGEWASMPPDEIAARTDGRFRAESKLSGLDAATDGAVRYEIAGTDVALRISWRNPFVGSNSYTCEFRSGGKDVTSSAPFSCARSGGSGFQASPAFTIKSRPRAFSGATSPRREPRAEGRRSVRRGEAGRAAAPSKQPLLIEEEEIDACGGYARNFGLHVDGVDCDDALGKAARAVARDEMCPPDWRERERVRIEEFNEPGEGVPSLFLCVDRDDEPGEGGRDRFAFQVLAH